MSAYIVSKKHIVFIVAAAMSPRILRHSSAFRWYWDLPNENQCGELRPGDAERAAEVANMLWMENVKSVAARYPNESSATLPGPVGEDFVITPSDIKFCLPDVGVVPVLKAIHGLEYQSCEHDGWRKSEAYSFLKSLEGALIRTLPGYEDAEWSL